VLITAAALVAGLVLGTQMATVEGQGQAGHGDWTWRAGQSVFAETRDC
jgi:hypothetical protein